MRMMQVTILQLPGLSIQMMQSIIAGALILRPLDLYKRTMRISITSDQS